MMAWRKELCQYEVRKFLFYESPCKIDKELATLMKRYKTAINNVIIKNISKQNKAIWKEEVVSTRQSTRISSIYDKRSFTCEI